MYDRHILDNWLRDLDVIPCNANLGNFVTSLNLSESSSQYHFIFLFLFFIKGLFVCFFQFVSNYYHVLFFYFVRIYITLKPFVSWYRYLFNVISNVIFVLERNFCLDSGRWFVFSCILMHLFLSPNFYFISIKIAYMYTPTSIKMNSSRIIKRISRALYKMSLA